MILRVRDENGNFIPINAIKGDSAYEQAVLGGYKGTEAEFIALLNGLTSTEDAAHYSDLNNPHKVTASQAGALPITGGTLTGKTLYFDNGNARLSGGQDYMQMDVFDSPKDDSNRRKLVLNGNNTSLSGAVVLTVREDGVDKTYTIYGSHNKPKASDVGAVSKSGDTMTGALTINKSSDWGQVVLNSKGGCYRSFEADDTRVRIDVRDENVTTDRRFIDIFSNEGDSRHSHALRFAQAKTGGENKTEYILHTGNINDFVISHLEYTGTGGATKTINIRKSTKLIIVYCFYSGSSMGEVCILPRGEKKVYADLAVNGSTHFIDNIVWSDTTVTLSAANSTTGQALNYSNARYHCVLLG